MSLPVYVVLVNYRRWADTIECMESLLRSDYAETRVIVVDNDPSDESLARMQAWARGELAPGPVSNAALSALSSPPVPKPIEFEVVRGGDGKRGKRLSRVTLVASDTNRGFAGGCNLGMQMAIDAGGDGYVALINNDMVVAPPAIGALVREARGAHVGAVGGVIVDYYRPDTTESVGGGWMSRWGMSTLAGARAPLSVGVVKPSGLGYVSGGLLLIPLSVIARVGLLDESYFMYAEDADWGERLRRSGYVLETAADARVWHKGSTAVGSARHDFFIARSSLRYVRKHWPAFLPLAYGNAFVRFLLPRILRGEWARARSVIRAILRAHVPVVVE